MAWPTAHLTDAAEHWEAVAERSYGLANQVWQDASSVDWRGNGADALRTTAHSDLMTTGTAADQCIPTDWQLLDLSEDSGQPLARMVVTGPLGGGEWKAADTIEVSGFTGWPQFYDVFRNADRVLRGLNATGVVVGALPVPPLQWTAAVRSSGTALIGNRCVWIRQSNYVAGSDHPHASRLIVHTTVVDADSREQLAQSVSQLSADVYDGFIDALTRQ